MNGDNHHSSYAEILDTVSGKAEFGIRCEVGTLVRTEADAGASLGHASNSETGADSAQISQRVFAIASHLQLVAHQIGNRLIVELAELPLAYHRSDHFNPQFELAVL